MANEEALGPRKTMFVLVIVVGCFAVLWPRILSPLMVGQGQLKPNQFDRDAGCCEVIFESEMAVLELVNEVCSSAVGTDGKLSVFAAAECRKTVNETCGLDIAAFLKRSDNVGKSTKVLLNTMKQSNSSCLKEHFGVPVWSLGVHTALNSWATQDDKVKQERSPILGAGPHPALRERGRAIPPGAPTPPSRGPVPMPPHARVRSPLSVYFDGEIKRPIGVLTTSAGKPLDVRETVSLNTDVFNNPHFWDLQSSVDHERIPERNVHSKATAALGYFVVTNDVSMYTKADVFNGIGKKTDVHARFSRQIQATGGSDLVRETGGIAVKFYTNEGNLDLLCLSFPVFPYRVPNGFTSVVHANKRNPKTNIIDPETNIDFITKEPDAMHSYLWLHSDLGLQNGYRRMEAFAIQTFEVNNKHGESYFVRFNFRTEQGLQFVTDEAADVLRGRDADYGQRDLYNAIATGNYPSWRLEMDVMTKRNAEKLHYNPFDVTRYWENGTYHTVTIGRMVINRNVDNWFAQVEQAIYNPGNLVPGIPGPPGELYKARRFAYRDTQSYRLGINHNNIEVNQPKYKPKIYNRDGNPPVLDNMKDAPNYYQNSFNGPVPYVDVSRPKKSFKIYDRNAVDLQPLSDFYNTFVRTEGERNRMGANIARELVKTIPELQQRMIWMLTLIDRDLGRRTAMALEDAQIEDRRPALVKPPPIPGMRPPLGSPGGPVAAPKSSMGFVMPIYTICIIVFFVYTLSKILFKRTGSIPYEHVAPDPQFRRRVFRDESRSTPESKLGPKERDAIVTAISGLVAEVHQQMEASYAQSQQRQESQENHTRPYTNGSVHSSPIIIASEYVESKEKTPEPEKPKEASPEPKEPSSEKEPTPEPKEPTPEPTPEESPKPSPEKEPSEPEKEESPENDNQIEEDLLKLTEDIKEKKENLAKSTEEFLNDAREKAEKTAELLKEALREDSPEEEEEIEEEIEEEEKPEPENVSVKVLGMELSALGASGDAPAPTPAPAAAKSHEADEVKSIFLETRIPQQSRVLVAEFEDRAKPPRKHEPTVVSGKMTLSLIQDEPRDTPERDPESTLDDFTTASAMTQPAAEKEGESSDEEIEEEIEIEEIEEEEEEEEEPKKTQK